MPLNESLKGREYQQVEFTIDRDRVVQFADAIGEDERIFRDAEAAKSAGYEEQLAPPTFVTVVQILSSAQVVLDQELGLDYSRVVHGEQEFEWRRPLHVGDTIRAMPRIADIYSRGPNEFLVVEAEVKDASGETVGVSRSTLLSRGTAGGS
jgi:acyl dehydratase